MEEWRDIPGYEGIYQASNMGRIRTAPGKQTHSVRHGIRNWQVRILKGRGDNPQTGKRASLWKDKKCKDWLVARLVAITWVPGFEDGMTVNHINVNRFDNRVSNLEWLSLADNIRHGFETGLYASNQQPVVLRDVETHEETYFYSKSEASRFLNKNNSFVSNRILKGNLVVDGIEIVPNCSDDMINANAKHD